ncbi:unnamed protein product [Rotaria sp. Silwood2]|nr:unnamed protein product [Rotaria sp. Silwood2]
MIKLSVFTIECALLLTIPTGSINNRMFINVHYILADQYLLVVIISSDWLSDCVAIERTVHTVKSINFKKSNSRQLAK